MRRNKCSALDIQRRDEPTYNAVTAAYLIRRMQGKSQSVLALCDDDLYYVVKFGRNPKGNNALANEILGYQLAESLNVRVPQSCLVTVSAALIRNAPRDWFDNYADGLGPSPGVHFGTQFVGTPLDARTSDLLPRIRIPRLENRDDFLGMLVFDIWANNQRPRQAVFERVRLREVANFIDFGSEFGGYGCVFCDDDFGGFYFDIDFYEKVQDNVVIDSWIARLRRDAPKVLGMTYCQIPSDWYTPAYREVRKTLLERLNHVEDLVYPIVDRLRMKNVNHGEPN